MKPRILTALHFVLALLLTTRSLAETILIEAEGCIAGGGEVFRDPRASGKKCAGILLAKGGPLVNAEADLAMGDYEATFWLLAAPVEVIHGLQVTLRAGDATVTLGQIQFDARQLYQPFGLRFFHGGGKLSLQVSASGKSGFDGMRKSLSDQEETGMPDATDEVGIAGEAPEPDAGDGDLDEALDEFEEGRSLKSLEHFDHHVLCDKIEVRPLRVPAVAVAHVEADKIHYLPGETVRASARLRGRGGAYQFVAEEVTEIDASREVFTKAIELGSEGGSVEFAYKLDDREFGHELRCSLVRDGQVVHSQTEFFGVSRNVYRIGITARNGGQDMRRFTAEQGAKIMQANKRAYANYFERFAWAACDYSNLAPQTEIFYSGQTQYPGSVTGFRNLLSEAHRVGVKGITYGKACAAGIHGFNNFQRYPEFYGHRPSGPFCEQMNVFYLERMLANGYLLHAKPSEGGWQHWASLWVNWSNPAAVEFGAKAVMDSIEMFGWDGIRWDGHFVGCQKRFLEILKENHPNFVHGYNIAFANPGGNLFLPPADSVADFHEVAADHGLMMDESVRDWSHTNFSSGAMRPFYGAINREADYIKRIGGLPLFITFDMASRQDKTLNVLFGLSAGERYTYLISPGDFVFGPLPKFLTRYSAFIWDDTKRLAEPDEHIEVTVVGGPKGAEPWWQASTWLRELPNGRQQLLVNLMNPPGYRNFCNRVQHPPRVLEKVAVQVKAPPGATLTRAFHVSPDLTEGHVLLESKDDGGCHRVILPRLRLWSIVGFEYEGASAPAFPLTTPVRDAAAVLKAQSEKEKQKAAEQKAKAAIAPSAPEVPKRPHFKDFNNVYNIDAEAEKGIKKPEDLALARNGILDVHHARGAFSWLNPLESAVAILGAGNYEPSWVNYVGFKLGSRGCMDEFPDQYDKLLTFDVLVLDNVHVRHLGERRRAMVADFVRHGGGLLVFGGYWNLSLGMDHNTYLAELLPIRIRKYRDLVRDNGGLRLKVEVTDFFADVDWSKAAYAFTVDKSELKDGARVLVTAGGHPAIVASTYGKGRIITVLMNQHGDYPDDRKPYWQWSQYPKLLAACLDWLGEGCKGQVARRQKARELDTSKMMPEELLLKASELTAQEFTAKLKEAMANVVDAESAKTLLETAVDSADKIEDLNVLARLADLTRPYIDGSFSELGEQLVENRLEFIRQAGYQILGLAGDRKYRPILEKGLKEELTEIAREALVGLGRLGDSASQKAVRQYLRDGSEKLLARSVLFRLGDRSVLPKALPAYEQALERKVRLKSGRYSIIDTLWGGVSFKLTRAQRRRAMNEYRKVLRLEAALRHDLRYFADSMQQLSDSDLNALVGFFTNTETPETISLAYTIFSRLPAARAKPYRAKLAQAKLVQLRLLAEE